MKSKLPQTFTICQLWSPELIYNIQGHARARVHAHRVKSCTLILPTFQISFLTFLSLSLLKMKKRMPHLKKVWTRQKFFILLFFFILGMEVIQNGRQFFFSLFFTKIGLNMRLRNKSHKIKLYCHKGMDKTEIFHFIIFFPFRYGSPSKWPPNFYFHCFLTKSA